MKKRIKMTKELQEKIDGILIGDGCIILSPSKKTARIEIKQISKRKDWLSEIDKTLKAEGFETSGVILKRKSSTYIKDNGKFGQRQEQSILSTKFYFDLINENERWGYVKNNNGLREKTEIPGDVAISPLVLAWLYMGDGNINKRDITNNYQLEIATHSFTETSQKKFIEKIRKKYGIHFHLYKIRKQDKDRWYIKLYKSNEIYTFLKIVEPYITESFVFKLEPLSNKEFLKKIRLTKKYMMGSRGFKRFFLKISPHHLLAPPHLLINFCVDTNVDMGHQKTMSGVSTQFSLLIFKVYPVLTKV